MTRGELERPVRIGPGASPVGLTAPFEILIGTVRANDLILSWFLALALLVFDLSRVGRRSWKAPCSLSARLDYTGSRLLDDRALARSIPLGERFDFVTGALALARRIGTRWDAQVEAYAGADLEGPDLLGGLEASLRLRLRRGLRLRFAAGYGTQARYQDGESGHIDIELELYR